MAGTILLLGLLVVASTVTATGFWPVGQELIYDYRANVQVGSLSPAHYTSEYTIYGKLRVQSKQDEAYLKLEDVKYQLYNGEFPHKFQSSPLPAPEEASPLSSTFRVLYEDGKVKKLSTEFSDPVWALNIKKGLAGLLQMDLTQTIDNDEASACMGEEDSIFGTCPVSYSFVSTGKHYTVTKTVIPEECRGYPYKLASNQERHACGTTNKENSKSSLYKRTYRIKPGNTPVLSDVTSEYSYTITPHRAQDDAFYVRVNQTATLLNIGLADYHLFINQEQEVHDLTYILPDTDSHLSAGIDFSQGRINVDTENLNTKAVSVLDEILEYQEATHIHPHSPNLKRSALVVYYVNQVLGRLNVDSLSSVYNQLSFGSSQWEVAKRDVFIKLLPEVGTHAAAITVWNLIRKQKAKAATAQELLYDLPYNIHNPNDRLLKELEDLISLNEEHPEEVRHAAILSFATLVYKAAERNPNADFVSKYAESYYKKIVDNKKDFATQLVYLQGLGNIQVGKAAEYLETIVTDHKDFSRHVRHLAMWSFAPNLYSTYNETYRIYWPILVNSKQHLQLRAAALKILLESASSISHFYTINSFMSTQKNNIHLYRIYYQTLQAKSSTTIPCYGQTAEYVQRILHFAEAPLVENWGSGVHVYDFTDKKYGFGKLVTLQTVGDQATGYPSVIYGEYKDIQHGHVETPYSVYLKMEGIEQFLWTIPGNNRAEAKEVPKVDLLGLVRKSNVLKADDFIRKVSSVQSIIQRPFRIELIISKQGRAIHTFFLDNNRLDQFLEKDFPRKINEINTLLQNMNYYTVRLDRASFQHLPTDLGVPLIMHQASPSILSLKGTSSNDKGLRMDTTFRQWSYSMGRLFVLNPVAGVWHGLNRVISKDLQIPIHFDFQYGNRGFKLHFGAPEGVEDLNAAIGSRWFKQSQTFIFEESSNKNLLGASCPDCKRVATITRGVRNLKNVLLVDNKIPGTGLVADVRFFDCEQDVSIPSFGQQVSDFFDKSHHNAHGDDYASFILGLSHLLTYYDLNPGSGQCGFLARLVPDPEVGSGSKIKVSFKVTGGEIPGGNIVLEGFKLNWVMDWVLTPLDGDAIEKTEIKGEIISTAANENNSHAIQITNYKLNKPNVKVCILLSKRFPPRNKDAFVSNWGDEKVHSKCVITVGSFIEDADGLCPSSSVSLTINMLGEITEEQKQRARSDDWPYGQCKNDQLKVEWQNYTYVPDTDACFEGSVLLTTARKITYSLSHSKLPPYLEEIFEWIEEWYRSKYAQYFYLVPKGQLAEVGMTELVMQYSAYKPTMDVRVKTPTRHYQYLEVPTGMLNAYQFDIRLDNTHYSRFLRFLQDTGISKRCIVNSENIYTADNATIPQKLTDKFVLVAGDLENPSRFSIYLKSQGGLKPLVMKAVFDGVVLEVSRDSATIDDKPVSLEKGIQVPADDPFYAIRAWKFYDLVEIYSRRTAIFVYYKGHSIMIEEPIVYRGRFGGLCGNLNGDPTDDY